MAGRLAVIYVGTQAGMAMYRNSNQGNWQRVAHVLAHTPISAIVAADVQTLLIAVEGSAPQQSFDGGISWNTAPGPAPQPIGLSVATVFGVSTTEYPRLSGATAYARLRGNPTTLLGAGADGSFLFRSEDDGIHWQPAGIVGGAAGRVTTLIPAVERQDSAWAGTAQGILLRSDDRGRIWQPIAREPAAILCLATVMLQE